MADDIIRLIVGVIGLITTIVVMRKSKSKVPAGTVLQAPLTGQEKGLIWSTCIVNPVLAGAIYYFGWRKVLPVKAKTANHISWWALLLLILVGIVFIVGSAHRAENELNNLTIDATGPLGVVEAIQTGILMSQAYDRRQNGPPGHFPATLGGADGSASTTNRLFANVLEPGVSDGSWSKAGATFTYTHGSVISIYDYNAATGAFTKR